MAVGMCGGDSPITIHQELENELEPGTRLQRRPLKDLRPLRITVLANGEQMFQTVDLWRAFQIETITSLHLKIQ